MCYINLCYAIIMITFIWMYSINGLIEDDNINFYTEIKENLSKIDAAKHVSEIVDSIDIEAYILWLTWFGYFMGGLLCLGTCKGLLGLTVQRVGVWGMDKITPHPHVLCEYREKHLKDRCVIHDDTGWPIHPDTYRKTVRVLSLPVEFLMNMIFFIAYPLTHFGKVIWWLGHCACFRKNKQDSEECYCEWVNTNCCECNAETKHLLKRKKSKTSDNSSPRNSQTNHKTRKHHSKRRESAESDSQPTSYDETNMEQENEDTKYVLNELNKSKISLNASINKFSSLNERKHLEH